MDSDTLNLGFKIGGQLGQEYISKSNEWFSFSFLKPYFLIDNNYVRNKLTLIAAPYLNKEIRSGLRNEDDYDQSTQSAVDYPDLYIPLMSFITYILIVTFKIASLSTGQFDPDVLGYKTSVNFFLITFYVAVLKVRKSKYS